MPRCGSSTVLSNSTPTMCPLARAVHSSSWCATTPIRRSPNSTATLASNPKWGDALVGRGFALLTKGRVSEAPADFDRALEINPDNATAFAGRGLAMLASRQLERATGTFDQAIAKNKEDPFPYYGRGRAF